MLLIDKTLQVYVNEVDSEMPTPGGGSVAALVGALGVSLAKMLAHLSIHKKKFITADKKKQQQFILAVKELEYYKNSLLEGIDEDAISYQAVMDAYQKKDKEEIQSALQSSAFVAFEMMTHAYKALKNVEKLIELGNKNVLSDLISGAILLYSCMEMAHLNVICNATLLDDEDKKNYYLQGAINQLKLAKNYKNKIIRNAKK